MDHSPFARLPPELRNQIYELALARDSHRSAGASHHRRKIDLAHIARHNALTQTCRRIRAESRGLFYAANDFFVVLPRNRTEVLRWFCEARIARLADLFRALGPDLLGCMRSLQFRSTANVRWEVHGAPVWRGGRGEDGKDQMRALTEGAMREVSQLYTDRGLMVMDWQHGEGWFDKWMVYHPMALECEIAA